MKTPVASVAFLFENVVDYQVPRLQAAQRALAERGISTTIIELFGEQNFYRHQQQVTLDARRDFGEAMLTLEPAVVEQEAGLGRRFAAGLRALRVIRRQRPAVVFSYGYHFPAIWLVIARKLLGGSPRLVLMTDSKQDDGVRQPWKEALKKMIVRNFDAGLVAGRKHVEYVTALGVPAGKSLVGLDVIDNLKFLELLRAHDGQKARIGEGQPLVVMFVGRLVRKKRVDVLIDAFASLPEEVRRGAVLRIVGGGEEESALRAQAAASGARGIEFAGHAESTAIPGFMASAHVLVLPSDFDQWGLVVNEAMLAKAAVIVTSTCGVVEELVIDRHTGLVVPPGDVPALTQALHAVITDHALRDSLVAAGHERVLGYSPQRFGESVRQLTELLAGA